MNIEGFVNMMKKYFCEMRLRVEYQTLKQRPIKSKNYINIAGKSCKGVTVGAVFKINLGDDSTPS